LLLKPLQQWQCIGGGLSGAGLGRAQHIFAFKNDGDGFDLDRRGRCETEIGGGLGECGSESQCVEWHVAKFGCSVTVALSGC